MAGIGSRDNRQHHDRPDVGRTGQAGRSERDALQAERIGMMRAVAMIGRIATGTIGASDDIRVRAGFGRRRSRDGAHHVLHRAGRREGIARCHGRGEVERRCNRQQQDKRETSPQRARAASRGESSGTSCFCCLPHDSDSTVAAGRRASADGV